MQEGSILHVLSRSFGSILHSTLVGPIGLWFLSQMDFGTFAEQQAAHWLQAAVTFLAGGGHPSWWPDVPHKLQVHDQLVAKAAGGHPLWWVNVPLAAQVDAEAMAEAEEIRMFTYKQLAQKALHAKQLFRKGQEHLDTMALQEDGKDDTCAESMKRLTAAAECVRTVERNIYGMNVETLLGSALLSVEVIDSRYDHTSVTAVRRVVQDLLVLGCCRSLDTLAVRDLMLKGIPPQLHLRLNEALGMDIEALCDLKSRLGKTKYHLFTEGVHWGKRKPKEKKRLSLMRSLALGPPPGLEHLGPATSTSELLVLGQGVGGTELPLVSFLDMPSCQVPELPER